MKIEIAEQEGNYEVKQSLIVVGPIRGDIAKTTYLYLYFFLFNFIFFLGGGGGGD